MQSNDARNLFQSEASLAQGRTRAAKAKRTAAGVEYGRPIWLGGNDGTKKGNSSVDGTDVSRTGVALSDQTQSKFVPDEQDVFISLAGKDESAGAAFDGGKTRILHALLEPVSNGTNAHMITAESGALVRRIDLESGLAVQVFRGHTAPVTALAVLSISSGTTSRKVLFSAGWDRSVKAWPLYEAESSLPAKISTPLLTHAESASDFIKALLVVPSPTQPVLLSGGSDRVIRLWSLANFQSTVLALDEWTWQSPLSASQAISEAKLDLLGTFTEHTRPITALELLPLRPDLPLSDQDGPLIVFSADSLGRIAQSELEVAGSSGPDQRPSSARLRAVRELKGNEASIGALRAGWVRLEVEDHEVDSDEGEERVAWEARLWSASRDRSAYAYTISSTAKTPRRNRRRPPVQQSTGAASSKASLQFGSQAPIFPETAVRHPDYVTAVLDFALVRRENGTNGTGHTSHSNSLGQMSGLEPQLITACSDEEIRLWTLLEDGDGGDDLEERPNGSTKVFDIHGNAADEASRSGGARLSGPIEGHWHEISALHAWWRQPKEGSEDTSSRQGQWWVASASYDGSIRRWSVQELSRIAEASRARSEATARADAGDSAVKAESKPVATDGQGSGSGVELTAEEEAELAELMGSDEES